MTSLTACLHRPAFVCLIALYVVAVSLVHDAASFALGALVLGLGLLRTLLIVKLSRPGPA